VRRARRPSVSGVQRLRRGSRSTRWTLREHGPDYVLLDGPLGEGDRLGDGRAHYSFKHRRHGVNVRE
jgi:hypothetical protein